jgi:hypothetical protein
LIFGLCFIQTIGTDHFHVVEPVIVDLTFCLLSKRDSWITSPRNKVVKEGKYVFVHLDAWAKLQETRGTTVKAFKQYYIFLNKYSLRPKIGVLTLSRYRCISN